MRPHRFVARWWVGFALLAAASLLAAAHGFERFGGYAPCALCLKQRDIYWFAIAIALPAWLWALFSRSPGTPRLASFLLFAVFAAGSITALFHAGVEAKWWPGPSTCTGGGGLDMSQLSRILSGQSVRPPQCDVAVWWFLGLSMAAWNAMIAAALSLVSLLASMRRKEGGRAA